MSSDEAFVVAVLAALEAARLEAVVVGNGAAILLGAPVTTQDLDLLVRDTPRNRSKAQEVARALGGAVRPISPLTSALRLDAPAGTVDILFDELPGGLSFQAVRARALTVDVAGRLAKVAHLRDVIASKVAADRPKDRAMLPILRDTLRVREQLAAGAAPERSRSRRGS